ncbi:CPBP family intramembrane glutamic endopeptidase [Paenibacillus sp. GCM10027628]|uniref:CPBP family intramembrane glutamic endopeptidase n=1 Tax=Paenibacillus sp. GCM10027628 TaxID=3273413 RepID=UPI0036342726
MNIVSVLLIVFFPLLGFVYYRNLSKLGKIRFYLHLIGWYWALTASLYALNKDLHIVTIDKIKAPPLVQICMWTVIIMWLVSEVLPVVLALSSSQYRNLVKQEVITNDSMPLTKSERKVFILVAITVGFCEEVLWRGLMPALFRDFSMAAWMSFVVAAVFFSFGHFVQGWRGIINSFILSVMLTLIFLLSGSLLIPIILHILYDYRLVLTGVIIQQRTNLQEGQ